MLSFIFIGGDMRGVYAARRLGRRYDCRVYGVDAPVAPADLDRSPAPSPRDYAVLPLPASMDGRTVYAPYLKAGEPPIGFEFLSRVVKPGGAVFTSRVFPLLEKVCADGGFHLINYFEREELTVLNAAATAEGAVEIALREMPIALFRSRVLITGFGRVGRALARAFIALGARVSVAARKYDDLAWAEVAGATPIPLSATGELERALPDFDLVLNTVPAPIFDGRRLGAIGRETLFIELASTPSIADSALAEEAGIRVIWARSLPGKTAPATAGEIIADTLENIINGKEHKR
ncbi:MAG: hypothetical protein NC084_04730 [Bacteroides sp.]|nr:dipicolinate synthase [Eubacterium sp.]MCM1418756.1 dipicolinate synthase [Roseburia sp.]MCM1462001.1 hypothetical protein [Bacteroides sp.]